MPRIREISLQRCSCLHAAAYQEENPKNSRERNGSKLDDNTEELQWGFQLLTRSD